MKKIQIAKIISTKQIVINAGAIDGVHEGDVFDIVDTVSDDTITDPETGKPLGKLKTFKGRVIISRVFDRMSIADAPFESLNGAIALNYQSDLNVDEKQIEGGLSRTGNPIQVGDVLEEVKG